jgi:hypothetical protein
MKKYKYVVVSGCSFSASNVDSTHFQPEIVNPGETYGDLIAEYFGAKFYNLAKSAGSFPRMNRKILEWCAKNKNKFNDTLIILGMTSLERMELWSNGTNRWFNDPDHLQEISGKSTVFKHTYPRKERKRFFMNFYNEYAQFLLATNMLIGLQSFLTLNNIDHVFFDAFTRQINPIFEDIPTIQHGPIWFAKNVGNNLVSQENWYIHPEYESMRDFTEKNPKMRISKNDMHPNKEAHKYWAEHLIEYINE